MRAICLLLPLIAGLMLPACDRSTPPAAAEPAVSTAPVGQPATAAQLRFKVIGTEPFWNIDIDGNRLHYTTMEDPNGRHLEARQLQQGAGWRWSGSEARGDYVLDIRPGECSDGMSDRRYGHVARFVIEGVEHRGCADAPEKFSGEGQQP